MSHPVNLDELGGALDRYGPHAFLLTTGDDLRPHVSHVTVTLTARNSIGSDSASNVVQINQ